MTKPVYGLMVRYRDYKCLVCNHIQSISTNHTEKCYDHCKGCSWRSAYKAGEYHYLTGEYRQFQYVGPAPTKAEHNPHSGVEWVDPV